jgi:hypothetical protein
LQQQTPATHAERTLHGELLAPLHTPRKEQVGDVGAGDQQHQQRDATECFRDDGLRRLLGAARA